MSDGFTMLRPEEALSLNKGNYAHVLESIALHVKSYDGHRLEVRLTEFPPKCARDMISEVCREFGWSLEWDDPKDPREGPCVVVSAI